MTPNFALSLSFDGIRLLHRVSGGWHLVDEVALDDQDLSGALARMRRTAAALEPSGLRTKLLLPNDQIKYLSIDSTQTTIDDVRNALHGATPYAIDDLVIDFNRSGGRTHIAAVARETLAEAEAFANQHRFAPVTFAAVAEPFTFNTEVFFGMTTTAADHLGAGVVIDRDADAVKVIGRATMPAPPAATTAMPLTMQADPVPEAKTASENTAEDEAAPVDDPVLTFSRARRDAAEQEPETPPQAPAAPSRQPSMPSLPEIDEPVFTSRAKAVASETGVGDRLQVDPPATASDTPVFERRSPDQDFGGTIGLQVAEDDAPPPPAPVPVAPEPRIEPGIEPGPQSEPSVAPPLPVSEPAYAAPPVPMAARKEEQKEGTLARGLALATAAGKLIPKRKEKAPPPPPPTGVGPLGGAAAAGIGGKPRYLGLLLTAGLLVFLLLVALWASTLDEDGLAGLLGFGGDDPTELASVAPEPAPETVLQPVAPVATTQAVETPAVATPPTPIVTTVPGRVLSPGEADRIYAATGVWQRAPRLPALPQEGTLDAVRGFATVPVVAPVSRPRDLAAAAASLDTPFLSPPDPAPAGTVIPRDDDGFILASADGTVMPNGVLVYAKAPAVKPPVRPAAAAPVAAEVPQDVPAAETGAENPLAASIAAAVADAAAQQDAPQAPVTEDLASGQELTPDETPTAGAVALASLRPAVRPQDLVPPAPFADEALAGLRPALRPENLAPPATEEPAEEVAAQEPEPPAPATDLASVIANIAAAAPPSALVNPTSNAIVVSPRPDTRPNNFSRVVASAQQNNARQQQQQQTTQASAPAVASTAAARPSGAIPQSVAAAATMDSAINLRNVNLIGVYGRPNDRRALIRLGSGSYVKVEVGSALEGGQVTAIGDSALNYVVGGRTYALQLPSG